jgi:long-chain acyl-CoA synthetase
MHQRMAGSLSFATVAELIAGAVGRHGLREALVTPQRSYTYRQLGDLVAAACRLLQQRGLDRSRRLAIVAPNHPAAIVAYAAAQCLGIATVEAGFREGLSALTEMVERAGSGLLLTERTDLREAVSSRIPVLDGTEFLAGCDGLVAAGAPAVLERRARAEDTSAIVFTSGTTGLPKGVMLSHANFAFIVAAIRDYLELRSSDRYALVLPLNHTYGKTVLLSAMAAGAAVVLTEDFQDLPGFLAGLARQRCTLLSAVPYHAQILLRRGDPQAMVLPHLRAVTFSGNKLYPETIAALRRVWPHVNIYSMYGLTESTTRVCYVEPTRLEQKLESCGRPLPGVALRVVDEAGRDVPPGEPGEVLVRGPNVMQGYLGDPELTAATLAGGWLHTGDQGHLDREEYLYLHGRRGDLIKCAGERISPLEIEQVLLGHPDVAEAAVVGRPDPLLGEAVHAYIVPGRAELDLTGLSRFCAGRLSAHKLPRGYSLVAELPKTATGKIRRKMLEEYT